jgi:hypothetical protein
VVVTGWMDGWPVRDKWTLPYLKQRLGDAQVPPPCPLAVLTAAAVVHHLPPLRAV